MWAEQVRVHVLVELTFGKQRTRISKIFSVCIKERLINQGSETGISRRGGTGGKTLPEKVTLNKGLKSKVTWI